MCKKILNFVFKKCIVHHCCVQYDMWLLGVLLKGCTEYCARDALTGCHEEKSQVYYILELYHALATPLNGYSKTLQPTSEEMNFYAS